MLELVFRIIYSRLLPLLKMSGCRPSVFVLTGSTFPWGRANLLIYTFLHQRWSLSFSFLMSPMSRERWQVMRIESCQRREIHHRSN